ncbi:MAG: hypothetical protein HY799_06880 [Nitrosomonadales bacterium]|nr:hypothetical protein [Nitrosomonadales bacterium]
MNLRLVIFSIALLFLPPLALTLAGQEWVAPLPVAGAVWLPALIGISALLAFSLLLDTLTFRRRSHSLLRSQRNYLLWSGVAGMLTGMLLAYLNLFADAWFTPATEAAALLLAALGGLVLLPAVLITRMWLAGLPGLVKLGTRKFALPALPAEASAQSLLLAALIGLLVGPIQTEFLGWLLWLSPLLLLVALQLLWHESTVFSGLVQGDWSRILLGALAGILACGIALASYRASGGAIYLASNTWQILIWFALFGLLCLQIGDIVAEHWRGKPRGEVFKRKPFPVSVVSKKDQ